MKALKLTTDQWRTIRGKINQDYPRSVSMVRWKMREVLGFTPRDHKIYDPSFGTTNEVHLDFFDESKRTMFLLKYGDWIR